MSKAVEAIGRIQKDLKNNKCPFCKTKAKIQVKVYNLKGHEGVKLVDIKQRMTHIDCPKCGKQVLGFSPRSKVRSPKSQPESDLIA